MTACANCSAELTGEYCAVCGERRLRADDLSATRLIHDLADQVANFRFKFKTLRTLLTLAKPGLLTADFLAGRRGPYLNPLRLYLVCAAIFFITAPWAGFTLEEMIASDQSGSLSQLVSARIATSALGRAHFVERFDLRIQTVYTVVLGVGAVAMALLLQLFGIQRDRPFGAHVVFALHFVSFQYLVTILIGASRQLALPDALIPAIGLCVIAVYLVMALRRVYGGTVVSTGVWSAALFALMLAVNFAASVASIRLTLMLV